MNLHERLPPHFRQITSECKGTVFLDETVAFRNGDGKQLLAKDECAQGGFCGAHLQ